MSQEKVNRYKKEKYNRKKTLKKQKLYTRLWAIAGAVLAGVFVLWVGYSIVSPIMEKKANETRTHEIYIQPLLDYVETVRNNGENAKVQVETEAETETTSVETEPETEAET